MNIENTLSLILPFIGTVIGSAFVFFFKLRNFSERFFSLLIVHSLYHMVM